VAADGRDRYQQREQRFQGFQDRTRAGQARQFRTGNGFNPNRPLPPARAARAERDDGYGADGARGRAVREQRYYAPSIPDNQQQYEEAGAYYDSLDSDDGHESGVDWQDWANAGQNEWSWQSTRPGNGGGSRHTRRH
jgi:hypothetical protein